jgi:hypothetical protein
VQARSRWIRSVRWLGLDGNPMRRTVDRLEAAIRIALLMAFLAAAPPIAARVAHHVAAARPHTGSRQTSRRPVTAVLLQDAPPPAGRFGTGSMKPLAEARWTAPDGAPRTGGIRTPWGQHAGSTVTIWTDDTGRSVDPPTGHSQLLIQATGAAALALAVLALGVVVIHQVVRHILDRRRMARWEADWSAVEPQWTGRRRHC